ncbi:hypothetical protein GCM10009677_35750 [Sphaerisporangium rubeum]|uniref:Putative membrane protein n=1 Tax=Sphaerisporangium rubeum TaxID=321317 RepID=A0A7X0IB63_9ACTN|nr:DUF2157 domain-containing protein [Sphaerisporangium rubeum]MBB6471880.1 putative membrane protein [Sphaerisporangium rubeum]
MNATTRVPVRRLAWMHGELARWQADGLIDAATASRIADRYVPGRRLSLERLILVLGGGFLGVGLIWLVSANLYRISPTVRFAGILIVWLGAVALGEILARTVRPGGGVEAARLVAVLAGGGVVFQAAQSLQVPAYDSGLLGVWAAGSLAYAYATGSRGPLSAALTLGAGWYGWFAGERVSSAGGVAVALVVAGAVSVAVAVLHESRWRPEFAPLWRLAGVVLVLVGLFVAAFPGSPQSGGLYGSVAIWPGLVAVVIAGAAAFLLGDTERRREVVAVVLMLVAAMLLAAWGAEPPRYPEGPGAAQTARAVAGTLVYVLSAVWFAVVAARRDLAPLVYVVTAALVLFVTVQSFAVFQPLLSGAALFLVLGVVFLVTGVLVDYGRRRLMRVVR